MKNPTLNLQIGMQVSAIGVSGISWTIVRKNRTIVTLRSLPNRTDHSIQTTILQRMMNNRLVSISPPPAISRQEG
jgi:hypothetical protein